MFVALMECFKTGDKTFLVKWGVRCTLMIVVMPVQEQLRGKCEVLHLDNATTITHTAEVNPDFNAISMEKILLPEAIYENIDQVMYSTPVKKNMNLNKTEVSEMPSPIHFSPDNSELTLSTDESMVDPIRRSKLPGAKPVLPKMSKGIIPDVEDPEQLTFSEKKRRFELVTKAPDGAVITDTKEFSFVSAGELERMHEEEERKLASMTEEELKGLHTLEDEIDEIISNANLFEVRNSANNENTSTHTSPSSGQASRIPVRTLKAENRLKDRLNQNDLEDDDSTSDHQRSLLAATRAAWRQARLKSLEEDAVTTQLVIEKAKELTNARHSEVDGHLEEELNNSSKLT
ncbi:hypothetical protein JTE90_017357 [Oedothorax gibbosus]|uniref:Uncharacterized protein n=1 Tax=Oedothorax gibbosus TaxID=931172 RepID=A0AAV6VSM6_9ARAC|nr:hypothetical protein JTE90_017357 [Oedothorax gibbosus]